MVMVKVVVMASAVVENFVAQVVVNLPTVMVKVVVMLVAKKDIDFLSKPPKYPSK